MSNNPTRVKTEHERISELEARVKQLEALIESGALKQAPVQIPAYLNPIVQKPESLFPFMNDQTVYGPIAAPIKKCSECGICLTHGTSLSYTCPRGECPLFQSSQL